MPLPRAIPRRFIANYSSPAWEPRSTPSIEAAVREGIYTCWDETEAGRFGILIEDRRVSTPGRPNPVNHDRDPPVGPLKTIYGHPICIPMRYTWGFMLEWYTCGILSDHGLGPWGLAEFGRLQDGSEARYKVELVFRDTGDAHLNQATMLIIAPEWRPALRYQWTLALKEIKDMLDEKALDYLFAHCRMRRTDIVLGNNDYAHLDIGVEIIYHELADDGEVHPFVDMGDDEDPFSYFDGVRMTEVGGLSEAVIEPPSESVLAAARAGQLKKYDDVGIDLNEWALFKAGELPLDKEADAHQRRLVPRRERVIPHRERLNPGERLPPLSVVSRRDENDGWSSVGTNNGSLSPGPTENDEDAFLDQMRQIEPFISNQRRMLESLEEEYPLSIYPPSNLSLGNPSNVQFAGMRQSVNTDDVYPPPRVGVTDNGIRVQSITHHHDGVTGRPDPFDAEPLDDEFFFFDYTQDPYPRAP